MRVLAPAAIAVVGVVWSSGEASAFCRSTTCRSTASRECPKDDDGCVTEGAKLFWPTSCVSYAMNELGTRSLDPVATRTAIRKSFQAWSEVPCPSGKAAAFTFEEREPVSCRISQYNKSGPNLNVVFFQDDDWRYRGIDGTLAKTSVTFNDDTGEIVDADIEVNSAFNIITISNDPKKVDYDLQAVMTHEVGHFIGIGHSPDGSAVMYESYTPGSRTQRVLTPDDVAAVCEIYPPESTVACNTEPRGGFKATCDAEEEDDGICSVGSPGSSHDRSMSASLSLVGVVALAAIKRATRAKALGGKK